MAATSFGHVTTNEIFPPGINPLNPSPLNTSIGYQPITGSIFDLLDANGVTWFNYLRGSADLSDFPRQPRSISGGACPFGVWDKSLRRAEFDGCRSHRYAAAGVVRRSRRSLPIRTINGVAYETDEHPPFDIRAGEFITAQIINAVRNSPNWKDTVIFLTYDEHGGFYDHVAPPAAAQGGALNPDGIDPGLCEDLSNPPTSLLPGGGAECGFTACSASYPEARATSRASAPVSPVTGPYPAVCANFNQLGFRVPFIVISPFAKPHYVSHTVGDHTSMLAFIAQRFLPAGSHLTLRDQNANRLQDMFDFNGSPSLNAVISTAPAPVPGEHDCPFP